MAESRLGRRLRMGFNGLFNPEKLVRNQFNEAFLWAVGGGFTDYDPNAKTYIKKGYNINPIVYSIVNQQATKTASIPYTIKRVKDEGATRKWRSQRLATKGVDSPMQYMRKAVLESKAFEEDEVVFPLDKPNATQTWTEFMALYKTFMATTGNAYIFMLRPEMGLNAGQPIQVYLLPSHMIQIIVKPNVDLLGVETPIDKYILIEGKSYIEFQGEDVIHIKYSNPNYSETGEHLYGQSPLEAALKNIQSSNEALNLNIKTLKSGGAFGFIHGKNMALNQGQADEIKSRLLEMDSSPERLSKIAGVSAEMGFTRLSLTSDELKPFDYLNFDQKMIANVLRWDDKLLNNDAGAKFDNVMFAQRRVVTDNIMPDLQLFSDAMDRQFLPLFKGYEGTTLVFDASQLPEMQTDLAELSSWLDNALDRGVINRNEYRVAIKYSLSEDKDMNLHTVGTDVMTLTEAVNLNFGLNA